MPDVRLRLLHPKVPGLIVSKQLTGVQHGIYVAERMRNTAPLEAMLIATRTPLSQTAWLLMKEIKDSGLNPHQLIEECNPVEDEEQSPQPERPLSRMVMWNQVSGHELQFDMTADEMLEWQKLRREGVTQYEALLRVMHQNEGVRKRIELHQREAERYLREGGVAGVSIVARPRVVRRVPVVAEEEEEMSSSSTSTTSAVTVTKPTEGEVLKSAAAFVKELVGSQAFKDFALLTIQFAKVHLTASAVEPVSIKVPQVDKTGAPAKPVEAGKLGSLAHALAVVQALPLPKKVKDAIASATGLGRVPTTPDALSAARSLVQSQLIKKPGSPLSAPASASPVAASPPAVVEQVAEQQAVAASVGKKRKSVDRTPVQSPVPAAASPVATSPEKKAASPKKRQKTESPKPPVEPAPGTDAFPIPLSKPSPKVRKTSSGGPKSARVTSVGGSEAVATALAAGLVGAGSSDDDWKHLDAMECGSSAC